MLNKLLKGLIIAEPHIDNILNGRKAWEMRSTVFKTRGDVALIRKGSGTVVGVVEFVDCLGPLFIAERKASPLTGLPSEFWDDPAHDKYRYAWVMAKVRKLQQPVRYKHKPGAQSRVNLSEEESREILRTLRDEEIQEDRTLSSGGKVPSNLTLCIGTDKPIRSAPSGHEETAVRNQQRSRSSKPAPFSASKNDQVPYASDGSYFNPQLVRKGLYQIGDKGSEQKYSDYEAALESLRSMKIARWRRPNMNGNWGVMTAVRWGTPK